MPPDRLAAVRAALQQIVTAPGDGPAALSNPGRMSNLLKDLLPDAQLEKTVLVTAADNGLAEALANLFAVRVPADAAIEMAADSLADRTGLTAGSCRWVARETAIALGYVAAGDQVAAPGGAAPGGAVPGGAAPGGAVPGGAVPGGAVPAQAGPGGRQPTERVAFTPQAGPVGATDPTIVPGPVPGPVQAGTPAAWAGAQGAPGPVPGAWPGGTPYAPVRARPARKIWLAAAAAAVVVVVAVVLLLPSSPPPHPAAAKPSVHVFHVSSGPIGVALDGTRAWIAQAEPDKIAELAAGTGREVAADTQDLDFPWDIATGDGFTWVVNDGSDPGSVTKLDRATGQVVQVLGSSNGIANPTAAVVQGTHLWVANLGSKTSTGFSGYGSVAEIDAGTGAVLRTFAGSQAGITYPVALAVDGPYVWVVDGGYRGGLGGVSRIDTRTGTSWTKSGASASSYGFERPASIAIAGSHVWVLNNPYRAGLSVTEMNESDGTWVQTLSGSQFDFGHFLSIAGFRAEGMAATGNRIWVVNPQGGDGHGSVTEIDARTGRLVRVLSGPPYNFYLPVAATAAGSQVWIASYGPKGESGWLTVLRSFR